MSAKVDPTVHRELINEMMTGADKGPDTSQGFQRCFYTLWGKENDITWETQPDADLVGSIVPGTGRQDWRKLRPFDLLPTIDAATGGVARELLYVGDHTRVSCAHIVGSEPHFERAGDFDTIFVQFSGIGLVETSFGTIELNPGEALLVPAMVAHRTSGSRHCRRMEYRVRQLVEVHSDPQKPKTNTRFRVRPEGDDAPEARPVISVPANGKIREHLSRWADRPGEDFWFERTYSHIAGRADSGRAPVKLRIFDYFVTTLAGTKKLPPVRQALLWDSPTFRQRVYSNPAKQPAPHRGYDEDELWFQFRGPIGVETEHAAYTMETGETSMAEAGVSHTSLSRPGLFRLTTYSPTPLRMVTDPAKALRETRWVVEVEEGA